MGKQFRFLETIPNFLLYFLFCGCVLSILLSGAKVYQRISGNLEKQFSVTTCASYITAKIRHYDAMGNVSVGKLGQEECLIFREEIEEQPYVTYLYCHEGNLKELFCAEDTSFSPQAGERIMPMEALRFELKDNMLLFSCEAENSVASSAIYLQCAE